MGPSAFICVVLSLACGQSITDKVLFSDDVSTAIFVPLSAGAFEGLATAELLVELEDDLLCRVPGRDWDLVLRGGGWLPLLGLGGLCPLVDMDRARL